MRRLRAGLHIAVIDAVLTASGCELFDFEHGVACRTDDDCPNFVCVAGQCRGPSAGQSKQTCTPPLAACAGRCVDFTSSAEDCGACGKACKSGQACISGVCADDCTQKGCTGSNESCNSSTKSCDCLSRFHRCSSGCVSESDPTNCGSACSVCSVAENATATCIDGKCGGNCRTGFHDGGARACVANGSCSPGFHDGGSGTCLPEGICSASYHDGGSGACVAVGTCSNGYRDGGTGACVVNGTCSAGYRDGGSGACVANGTCSTGFHDGGLGTCVTTGTCSTDFHDGGAGTCVTTGTCSTGYHDGGVGTCVADGTCSNGFHDGGLGTCVTAGVCSTGYHDGGMGTCVTTGTCSTGYHDGGVGTCVTTGTCSAGYHDGGQGTCVTTGTCSSGYHDGGTGACAAVGSCSPGFHDGGAGICLANGTCSAGYHDGGSGACVATGTCSNGYHDGGTGACVTTGACSSGYHDGGAGTCVTTGTCSTGYHDGGAGACVTTGSCSTGYHDGAGSCYVNVTVVAAGGSHSCAVLTTGSVKCWGSNNSGQLGDGTTTDRWTPVDVAGLTSGVLAVSLGSAHSCALLTTGGVKCWGEGAGGRLGDGQTSHRWTPMDVSGLTSGVRAIGLGGARSCALMASGGVKCWGSNYSGGIGDGTTTDRLSPVDVSGLTSGVTAIATGEYHSCALHSTAGLKCWGEGSNGQLGDGTSTDRWTPVSVNGLASGILGVSAGVRNSGAVLTIGGAKCWGDNAYGGIGDGFAGSSFNRATPVSVTGLSSGVSSVAAGERSCALLATGAVMCWGNNNAGQVGDGTTTNRATPVNVSGLSSSASSIATGPAHACAVLATGGVECWGYNGNGQIGTGTTTDSWVPAAVSGL